MRDTRDIINEIRDAASDLWEGSDREPTSEEVHGWADHIESQAATIARLTAENDRLREEVIELEGLRVRAHRRAKRALEIASHFNDELKELDEYSATIAALAARDGGEGEK